LQGDSYDGILNVTVAKTGRATEDSIRKISMKKNCTVVWPVIVLMLLALTPAATAQVFTNLHSFVNGDPADGALPNGVVLANNVLMGATSQGGSSGNGTIFQAGTNGAGFGILRHFDGSPTDGSSPNEPTISGSLIYGTTYLGGSNSMGVIYRVGTNGTGHTVLKHFDTGSDAQNSVAALILGGGTLYGTSLSGGSNGWGTVFRIDTNGGNFAVIHHFTNNPDGASPRSRLLLLDGTLFGTTSGGGTNGAGTIFRMNTNGADFSVIGNCSATPGPAVPFAGLTAFSNVLYGVSTAGGADNAGSVFRLGTNGAGFSIIHSFTNFEGLSPQGTPVVVNGVLYGNTISRGTGFSGTVFRVETNGANFTVLQNFTNTQTGANPKGMLSLDGTTIFGIANGSGPSSGGTLFRLQLVPAITSQPQNLTVTNGNPATFTVAALDETPVTYQWYFNSGLLGGQTNSSLNIPSAGDGNAGSYSVVVADKFGSVTSSPASLTVLSKPNINGQPQNLTITNGNNATFNVTAINGTLTYQWYFNTNTILAGQTNSSLILVGATTNNAGDYSVVVANNIGNTTSTPAILIVIPVVADPVITAQPQNLTVTNGDTAAFNVTATNGTLAYQWYFNTNNLLAGQTNNSLAIPGTDTSDAGAYTVVVANGFGIVTSSPAILTVVTNTKPIVTIHPSATIATNGGVASFTVAAVGQSPLRYQWFSNTTGTAVFNVASRANGQTNATLNINVSWTNDYYYYVRITNSLGITTGGPALLTVVTKPLILTNPESATVSVGDTASFDVSAFGQGPLRYQWYSNSVNTAIGTALAGQTNSDYSFTSAAIHNGRYYAVVVTNIYGRATSSPALLTLNSLFISQHPTNAIVTNGGFVSFTSAASGAAPLGYQWLFNTNTPIPGATSTNLIITNANQPGAYSMKATNSSGAVTSSPAILTVVAQPAMLSSAFNAASGSYSFSFVNVAGSTNRLWTSTNLANSGAWVPLVTNIMATNGFWFFTDSNSAKTNALRFYRYSTP
jgi:uncharacterized repeat protein (TIGR03803 family)